MLNHSKEGQVCEIYVCVNPRGNSEKLFWADPPPVSFQETRQFWQICNVCITAISDDHGTIEEQLIRLATEEGTTHPLSTGWFSTDWQKTAISKAPQVCTTCNNVLPVHQEQCNWLVSAPTLIQCSNSVFTSPSSHNPNNLAQRCPHWFWLGFCFSPPCKQCKPCLSPAWDNLTPCHLPLVCFVLPSTVYIAFQFLSVLSGVWLIDCHILSSPVCWTLFSFRATCLLFHCLLIWPQFSPAPHKLRINCANNWLQLAQEVEEEEDGTVVYKQSSPRRTPPPQDRLWPSRERCLTVSLGLVGEDGDYSWTHLRRSCSK